MNHNVQFETFNANEDARAPKHLRKPTYYAVEVENDRGVFKCEAKDNFLWSLAQLQEWALQINCALVIARWRGEGRGNDE